MAIRLTTPLQNYSSVKIKLRFKNEAQKVAKTFAKLQKTTYLCTAESEKRLGNELNQFVNIPLTKPMERWVSG